MGFDGGFVLIVSMDVDADKEALFNEVYDEHVVELLKVPGVRDVTRFKGQPFNFAIGGEIKAMTAPKPVYCAVYDVESPDVVESDAWAEAVEKGRWGSEVRPFTRNRSHSFYRKLDSPV